MQQAIVCGPLFGKYQRADVQPATDQIFTRVEIEWQKSPAKAVIKLPNTYRLIRIAGTFSDATEVKLNRAHEWETTVEEAQNGALYCVAFSLKSFATEDSLGFRIPYNLNVATDEGRAIPARVSLCISYQADIHSHTNFTRAFSQKESLTYDDLHESIRDRVKEGSERLRGELENKTLTLQQIPRVTEQPKLIEQMEREINGSLNAMGILMERLHFSTSEPFDRLNSTAWTDYQNGVDHETETETLINTMDADARLMKKYNETLAAAKELNQQETQKPEAKHFGDWN